MGEECGLRTLALVKYLCEEQGGCLVELETNLREVCSFTIKDNHFIEQTLGPIEAVS